MKTTGVSDIPKFGLLDFLGHPSPDGRATPTSRVDGKGLDRQQQAPPGDDSIVYTILFNV